MRHIIPIDLINTILVTKYFVKHVFKLYRCYRPSIISVTVTTGEHLRGNKLYRTSKAIG